MFAIYIFMCVCLLISLEQSVSWWRKLGFGGKRIDSSSTGWEEEQQEDNDEDEEV